MYEYFEGSIQSRTPTGVVVDVGGVGYRLQVPLSTYERLPGEGRARVYAWLHFQEGLVRLFGFATTEERDVFVLLNTVSGVGPMTALSVLSGMPVADFRAAVVRGDVAALKRVRGIGQKTAQRLVLELKDTLAAMAPPGEEGGVSDAVLVDAVLTLVQLSYSRAAAEKAAREARKELGPGATVEALVKGALKRL
ncbi:MAG: Holliday junction branch migration protein RuvA [Planctomycetota bacterium]